MSLPLQGTLLEIACVVLEREWSAVTYVKIVAWEEGQVFWDVTGGHDGAIDKLSFLNNAARGKEKYWR